MSKQHLLGRKLPRRTVVRGGLVGAGALAVGLTPGCAASGSPAAVAPPGSGGGAPATAVAAASTPPPKRGGTIRTSGTGGHRHFDVHDSGSMTSASYQYVIAFSGLLKFKHGPDVKPPAWIPVADLAESWEQPDDLTYVFKLRRGVRFHNIAPVNGRELVADDVVFSYNRQRDLKVNSAPLVNVLKLETPDKFTLKVTLDRPNSDLFVNLADDYCRIVAHEVVDQKGDLKQGPVIGTGPWIVDKVDFATYDYLVRNPDYFLKELPYADRIELNHIADYSNIVSAFRARELDLVGSGMTPRDYETIIKAAPEIKTTWIPHARSGDEIGFNTAKPPFDDVRVRQAVLKALDFQVVIDTIWIKRAELTTGVPLPDETTWKLSQEELQRLFKRDVEGARRLLREAGLERGFEAECIFVPMLLGGVYQAEAEIFQQQLREVGITLNLKPMELSAFNPVQLRGDYQIHVHNQGSRPATNGDLLGRYHSKGPANLTKFSDPKLDDLIEKQAVLSRDPEGRKKLLIDIQRYVVDRAFKIGICSGQQPTMFWPYVKNYWPVANTSTNSLDQWTDIWLDK
jgi:peptide/nickel transport system substrate-binding protein